MNKIHLTASLILVTRSPGRLPQIPKILALKRSSQMKNFPKAIVFPGGYVDEADQHTDWFSIVPLSERDVNLKILRSKKPLNSNAVPEAVSLRIAAIRETFEECGILLCKKIDTNESISLSSTDGEVWRKKIHKNASEFVNFCRAYRCFPDLKGLYLSSNWITPVSYPKRFNTFFFVNIIDRERKVAADETETDCAEWGLAKDFVDEGSAFLAPPQIYELTKLKQLNDVFEMEKMIKNVDSNGCQPITPVQVKTIDGEVFLLPGDARYEELFNENAASPVKVDCDNVNFRCDIMHRVEIQKLPDSTTLRNVLIQNVNPEYNGFATNTNT